MSGPLQIPKIAGRLYCVERGGVTPRAREPSPLDFCFDSAFQEKVLQHAYLDKPVCLGGMNADFLADGQDLLNDFLGAFVHSLSPELLFGAGTVAALSDAA